MQGRVRTAATVFNVPRTALLVSFFAAAVAAVAADDDARAARQRRRTPVVDVFEKCSDAVVNISTTRVVEIRQPFGFGSIWDDVFERPRTRRREVSSVGSGFIVHRDGYIVTNAHVVRRAADIQVITSDDRTIQAEVVAEDAEHDLAILKIPAPSPLPYLKLGRSDDIMIGETVIAIGNPFGFQNTVTAGIISALDRDLHFGRDTVYRGLIQTDTPINPGNSGGPLFNVNAELIGVNTAIRGDAQNIGFAIPVARLWALLPGMLDIERRERVRIGMRLSGRTAEVVSVLPDSPAARAGVRTGDFVTTLNGKPIENGIDYYARLLGQRPRGKLRLGMRREGRVLRVDVAIETVPPPDGRKLAGSVLHMTLKPIPRRLRRELKRDFGMPDEIGFVIESIDGGTAADRSKLIGLGDVVVSIGGVPATSFENIGLVLEGVEPGAAIEITGLRWRGNPPIKWSVTLPAGSSAP